ncbi:hypothetical protein C0J52_16970 [Blattella germanica]|nr:hypothetical protein C0J52_16970 [Blattella germanica]
MPLPPRRIRRFGRQTRNAVNIQRCRVNQSYTQITKRQRELCSVNLYQNPRMDCSSCLLIPAIFILCAIGFAYLHFVKIFKYWKKKGVKYIKPIFPFGTNKDFILMRKSIGDLYADHYFSLKGEKVGGLFMVYSPQLMVRDPELIKYFLVKDFEHFHDHGFASDPTFDPLSGNLFMLNGEKWKYMRTKLSPTFTAGKMKMMFQTVADCGVELRDFLVTYAEKEEVFEVKDLITRFTIDVIASCAFGIRSNCLKNPNAEFSYWGKRALALDIEGLFRTLLYLAVPSLALKFRISMNSKDVEKFFISMVRETVGLREKHNVRRNDFLQLLINLKNQVCEDSKGNFQNEKIEMTMEELAAQVVTFLIAGFETSAATMSFCLYELAVNPDVQKCLCK